HQSEANQWIHLLLPLVNQALADCAELPARQMEELDLEAEQIGVFFHDGTERAINRPQDRQDQVTYYSGKQKQQTIKIGVIINKACKIRFVTETDTGRKHEKKLADEEGYRGPGRRLLVQDAGL